MKSIREKGILSIKGLAVVIILVLTAAPVLYLIFGSVASLFTGTLPSDSGISGELFVKSVILYLASAGFSMLLGLLSAIGIWVFFEKHSAKIAILIILMILIPPFIHVQSWISFIDGINNFIAALLGVAPNFTGNFAVILTVAFSYLPVTAGLCLIALLSIPPELSDMCLTDGTGRKSFLKLYLPFIYPALILSGLLVFLLNINDYGIASVFGVNVYALELFSRFSAGGTIYSIFFASIPLLLVSAIIMMLFAQYIRKGGLSFAGLNGKNPFKKEKFIKVPAIPGLIVLAFFMLVPIISLLYEAFKVKGIFETLSDSTPELAYSLFISVIAAVVCLIPALLFAFMFNKSRYKIWLLAASALPFIIPAPIAGISLIEMWNKPLLNLIYQSPIMPSIGLITRFVFIEAIILSVAVSRIDPALIDNLRLHYPGIIKFFTCTLRLIWKESVSAMMIVFALSMGEFGVTLLVTPPGYQTLTVKIYNYVHYGSSETVAAMCLFMMLVVLSVSFGTFFLLTGKKDG
ncbi:MAG: hypothetical protein WC677_05165 [Clostridia bacterium]|jgi:iron(III) transport system permease protein